MSKGSSSSAPAAPDPYATANAQQQLNNNTAQFNAALNNVNQFGPYGSTQYNISGYDPKTGAPIYNQTTQLNPNAQQALNNQQGNQAYATGLAGQGLQNNANMLSGNPMQGVNALQTGVGNSGNINQQFSADPYSNLSYGVNQGGIDQGAMNASFNSQYGLLKPIFDQQTEQNKAEMAAQGITDQNSQAYKTSTDNLARQQGSQINNMANNAYLSGISSGNTLFGQGLANAQLGNSAMGQNYGQNLGAATFNNQAQNQQYTQNMGNAQLNNSAAGQQFGLNQGAMNQALTNYGALNGGAPGMPNASSPATSASSPANLAGAIQNQYQGQLANYNAGQASSNNFMNGLFGLGSAYLLSDARAKTDIKRVGTTDGGLPVYTYKYKGDHVTHMGVMAQDVEKVRPDAVGTIGGFKAVDYSKVA